LEPKNKGGERHFKTGKGRHEGKGVSRGGEDVVQNPTQIKKESEINKSCLKLREGKIVLFLKGGAVQTGLRGG